MTNLWLIVLSVLLQRKTFIVFGVVGFLGYLGHLSYEVFKDSMAFPAVLSLIGLVVIWLGILYKKNETKIGQALIKALPNEIKSRLPQYRKH